MRRQHYQLSYSNALKQMLDHCGTCFNHLLEQELIIFLLCRWTRSTANQDWRQYTKDVKLKDLGTDEYEMAVFIYNNVFYLSYVLFMF